MAGKRELNGASQPWLVAFGKKGSRHPLGSAFLSTMGGGRGALPFANFVI